MPPTDSSSHSKEVLSKGGSSRLGPGSRAFTLIEVLVSVTILLLLLLLFSSMVGQTGAAWRHTMGKIDQFRSARNGFEAMTRRLSEATLNTYYDYFDSAGNSSTSGSYTGTPSYYGRQSELRFISGPGLAGTATSTPPRPTHAIFFQAPLGFVAPVSSSDTTYTQYQGLNNLVNTWGYYLEFADDQQRPSFMSSVPQYRFRLMELMEPTQSMSVYKAEAAAGGNSSYSASNSATSWFMNSLQSTPAPVHVLAENIVALVLLPKLSPAMEATGSYTDASLAPTYRYDSTGVGMSTLSDPNLNPKSQLPPIIQVTMVAVDEASYARFQSQQTGTAMPALYASTLFTDATQYSADLATLQKNLRALRLNYQVFTSDVSIKGAKWSTTQTQ